ncbi:MAG: hypothetical protein Q8Q18_00165 [bacterium]|nr:hypothetical protein [bacterium]
MKRDDMNAYATQRGISTMLVSISGILLFLGGASIILGVYAQQGLILLIFVLIAISFKMHAFWKHMDMQMKIMDETHFLKNMALIGACLIIASSSGFNWEYVLSLAF